MDRNFVYDGALGQSIDVITPQVNAMNGIGKLSEVLLGQIASAASGLSCIPSAPPALTVQVLPGQLYSTQTVDSVAFGNSAVNSNPLVKQYVLWTSKTLSCPAPTTTGFSINYLIQVQPVETDGNLQTLQYFNPAIATNPAAPNWTGPNNTGAQQPTTRTSTLNVTAKAGVAAASGSQTTPAPDSGYVGLWVVTVTQGQTTINSGNISQYSGALFIPTLWQLALKSSAVLIIPATTFYINGSTGSDSNNGLTPSTAFATGQGAVNYISQFYASSVTINVAAGTYVVPASGAFAYIQKCLIQNWIFVGAGATTCLINASATAAMGFYSAGPTVLASGFGVTTSFYAFNAAISSQFYVHDNNVTLLSGGQAYASANGSYMQIYGACTVLGTGLNVFFAGGGIIALGYHDAGSSTTLTMNYSSVTVTGNNAVASNCGTIVAFQGYCALSGTVTGQRYLANGNGVIATSGGGANFFPGTVAGVSTYGQYN